MGLERGLIISLSLYLRHVCISSEQEPESALKNDDHPGPTAEIEFWANKSTNLNLIHEQLNSEPVRKVMKVLEVTKSTYFPAFNRLCKEVAQARMEVGCNFQLKFTLSIVHAIQNLKDQLTCRVIW